MVHLVEVKNLHRVGQKHQKKQTAMWAVSVCALIEDSTKPVCGSSCLCCLVEGLTLLSGGHTDDTVGFLHTV